MPRLFLSHLRTSSFLNFWPCFALAPVRALVRNSAHSHSNFSGCCRRGREPGGHCRISGVSWHQQFYARCCFKPSSARSSPRPEPQRRRMRASGFPPLRTVQLPPSQIFVKLQQDVQEKSASQAARQDQEYCHRFLPSAGGAFRHARPATGRLAPSYAAPVKKE
jgi:hypothetical protein